MSTDLETTLREAMEWDRKFLGRTQMLAEGRLRAPAPPPDVEAVIDGVEREVELNETLSLPTATPLARDLTDAPRPPAPTRTPTDAVAEPEGDSDLHARLHAALGGERYVRLPRGVHQQLHEALAGQPHVELPADIHARLAYGLGLIESADPVPPGVHTRLLEAITGEPHAEIPADLHQRLFAALNGR